MPVSIKKNIVKKKFHFRDTSIFLNEIYWLNKLKKYKFVPKILAVDYNRYIINLSYEGEAISRFNKPNDWKDQLKKILIILKKNNCFHSDIKPDNILVKKKKLFLIDFAQSIKIDELKKDFFLKKRIFFDQFSINRVNLSINENQIYSNDLRVIVVWNSKFQEQIEKKIKKNKNILIIDKIKLRKNFYTDHYKDRIFWVDQFYNKYVSKKTNKLNNNIVVFLVKSINPIFKSNKMMFDNQERIVDDRIFKFKKKIRKNKLGLVHISDNFEEAKRNAISFSKSQKDYPSNYFITTQKNFKDLKDFFKQLNHAKRLKYVILRKPFSERDDLDILVNDYYLFKKISDCHSYKKKNYNFISNSGDPVDENGIKVSNYVKINHKKIRIDVRFIGDNYFDSNWQKKILITRKFGSLYFVPNKENFIYSLIYHIVFHKGYIDQKYLNILRSKLRLKTIDLQILKMKINSYLSKNKYKITRPSDLTIPITRHLNNSELDDEFLLIEDQIYSRNFSGANKMIYNLIKYQKKNFLLKKKFFKLFFLNQLFLFKFRFKNIIFRYVNVNGMN